MASTDACAQAPVRSGRVPSDSTSSTVNGGKTGKRSSGSPLSKAASRRAAP